MLSERYPRNAGKKLNRIVTMYIDVNVTKPFNFGPCGCACCYRVKFTRAPICVVVRRRCQKSPGPIWCARVYAHRIFCLFRSWVYCFHASSASKNFNRQMMWLCDDIIKLCQTIRFGLLARQRAQLKKNNRMKCEINRMRNIVVKGNNNIISENPSRVISILIHLMDFLVVKNQSRPLR